MKSAKEKLAAVKEFYASEIKRQEIIKTYDELFRNWRVQLADAILSEKNAAEQREIISDSKYGFELWCIFRDYLVNLAFEGDPKSLYDLRDYIFNANEEHVSIEIELLSALIDYLNTEND